MNRQEQLQKCRKCDYYPHEFIPDCHCYMHEDIEVGCTYFIEDEELKKDMKCPICNRPMEIMGQYYVCTYLSCKYAGAKEVK